MLSVRLVWLAASWRACASFGRFTPTQPQPANEHSARQRGVG
jgi:hypothetical protein